MNDALAPRERAERPLQRDADDGAFEADRRPREFVEGRCDEGDIGHLIRVDVGDEAERAALGDQELGAAAAGIVGIGVAREFAFERAHVEPLQHLYVEAFFQVRNERDIRPESIEGEGGEERRTSGRPPSRGGPIESDVSGDQGVRGGPLTASG
ncbi:hypothetical protein [Candidatus Amarobacter glycogenicus]|uniref:hypothetical protein n=1 Tax=Candidatus Amarobacter glycogenicus TaxID=3140699 RepID=UPI0031CCA56F